MYTTIDYRRRIEMGEISFENLAMTESDCSSSKNQGDLGFFGTGKMQGKKSFLGVI